MSELDIRFAVVLAISVVALLMSIAFVLGFKYAMWCVRTVAKERRRRVLDVDHASHTITLESADIEAGDVLIVVSPAKRGH